MAPTEWAVQRRRLTALRAPYRNRAGHRPWHRALTYAPSHRCTHARLDCHSQSVRHFLVLTACSTHPHAQSVFSATQGLAQCRPALTFRHRTKARACRDGRVIDLQITCAACRCLRVALASRCRTPQPAVPRRRNQSYN